MPDHKVITDPELHEPKGVSTAPANHHYIADGLGSGVWEKITGFGQYQDSRTTVGSPALTLSPGVRTLLVNDGGTLIKRDDPSDLINQLWDTVNNKHVPISEDDIYGLRVSWKAENYAGTSPYLFLELDIGGVPGVILDQTFPLLRGGNVQSCLFDPDVFTGSTYIVNGGEFYLTYSGTGTCDIFGVNHLIMRKSRST